jgi:hypothetical protein
MSKKERDARVALERVKRGEMKLAEARGCSESRTGNAGDG